MAKQTTKYLSDGTTPAAASYDEGTIADGAASTPRRIWWKNTSTLAETLAACRFRIVSIAGNDGASMMQIAADQPLAAPAAPAAAAIAGAGLGIGHYHYAVSFVTANGETGPGAEAGVDTTGGNQRVDLTDIPIGPAGTTARRLYRTAVGGAQLKLLHTIADNVNTTFTDSAADGTLGADAPTLNTSGGPGSWGTSPITIGDVAANGYTACWMRYSVPSGTPQAGNPRQGNVQLEET